MIRSEVRSLIQAAGYGNNAAAVSAQDYAISAALAEISAERFWSWLRDTATSTLTIGSQSITEPTDFVAPLSFKIKKTGAAYEPLEQIGADELDRLIHVTSEPTPAEQGVPSRWAFVNLQVRVWPRPDAAYTYELTYIKEPTLDFDGTFAGAETIPFTGDQFHTLVAWTAMRWLAWRSRDWQQYDRAAAEAGRLRIQLEGADRRGEATRVGQWPGWDALG